jgi:hypothetical protein
MSVVIQSGFTGNAQPIDQPRICFDKHTATAAASGTASGYDPALVTDGETWSLWRASTFTSTLTITFASNQSTNYAALGAHNLGSGSSDVQLQTSTDGSTFVNATGISSHSPTDDSAIVWLFETASLRAIRFSFSGGFLPPTIGVAQAGEVLEMPQLSVFTGLPISESKQVRYRHQQSITGDVLGRAVEGADLRFDMTVQNLPETFRAAAGDITWKGFINHVDNTGPFFIAAKPESYPDDVAYARATERPRFNRERPNLNNSGAVTFQCMGYAAP